MANRVPLPLNALQLTSAYAATISVIVFTFLVDNELILSGIVLLLAAGLGHNSSRIEYCNWHIGLKSSAVRGCTVGDVAVYCDNGHDSCSGNT